MNQASLSEPAEIFGAPLDSSELAAINALVEKHRANATVTQQLAMDASRLVTASQERLARQAEAGFFKRLTHAVSGKTSENQALNQADMLQMQRFAWHYLQQLQQQNLITAQSIAVIRNNLGTMNEVIIETRDFLEQAIDRIDQRLRHVENNTNFNNWALNIEANKRRFAPIPKNLLVLRLAYDFLRQHPGAMLTGRDVGNYLVTTLEKLGVNCDETVRLLDFINDLIDQIGVVGLDQYRAAVALSTDSHHIDSAYIQKSISGVGFNALYFLADHYEKIADLIGDPDLCASDAAREKIIAKFFGQELNGLAATYSIRDLICEIIGGSQLAIAVYRDQHGLDVPPEAPAPEAEAVPEQIALVSSLPDITAHSFLDACGSQQAKRDYLLLLALCVDNAAALNGPASEFVALLADHAGMPELRQDVLALADDPRKALHCQPIMHALLDDENKKATWLLDAFFLLTLAQKPIESPAIKIVLGLLKPANLKDSLPNLLAMVNGEDPTAVLDAAGKLNADTQGWKNVVRYRALRFEASYSDVLKLLSVAGWANLRLTAEFSSVPMKAMEYSFYMASSDGGFLSGLADKAGSAAYGLGRRSALSSLNELRKKARDFLSEHRSALYTANSRIARWNLPGFEFSDNIPYSDYVLDDSTDNEDWGDQFQRYYNEVDHTLNAFSSACTEAAEQLEFFVNGDFDSSVIAIKERKRAEWQQKQALEQLEKQSVAIVKDGEPCLLGLEWQQVAQPPCEAEKITHIRTDGKIWLVVASIDSKDHFYRSEGGLQWQEVRLDAPEYDVSLDKLEIVNGVWIVWHRVWRGSRPAGFYYSRDALSWQRSAGPAPANNSNLSLNDGHLSYQDIVYFNGMWLWTATKYRRYSYVEKGFFSDTTKSGSYAQTVVFRGADLAGPWEPWDQTPRTDEGVVIERICGLPGRNGLLAFCKYDWSYMRDKKKPEQPPFVMYYGAAKAWQKCDWDSSSRYTASSTTSVHLGSGGGLMCVAGELFTSDKGYAWTHRDTPIHIGQCFALRDLSLITSSSGGTMLVSQDDGLSFKELRMEDGHWNHLAANDTNLLAVYYENRHEETVLRIGRYRYLPQS
ncbi:hypothetical protein WJ07_18060 [Burkholderia vietnamiensis]|uniref:hypothetical protein n=1 Tax=Burkholderia vietnamiensis TaxID=60552 RepID=UPI000752A367|nr:hypothetical protein [Burkholderia vietnamiensis]KVF21816.1 hypothetical protein WJ07_18060 [Burkholderia vietnamiensis]